MHPGKSHLEVEDAHAGELEMLPRSNSGDILDADHLQARQTRVSPAQHNQRPCMVSAGRQEQIFSPV